MKRRFAASTTAVLVLFCALSAPLFAEECQTCPTLAAGTEFVDLDGNPISPIDMDVIALREVGHMKMVVYQRNPEDAAALVARLQKAGVTDPLALDTKAWLAQKAGCRRRPNGRCEGPCPGVQKYRNIKRPGRPDICQCVIR